MATYYYPSGCTTAEQVAYACSGCSEREFGRIRAFALIKESYLSTFTDFSSPSQWSTALLSLNAVVIYKVNGEYDGGETEELDGFGDTAFDNGNTTHTMIIRDPNVVDNTDYYNYVKQTNEWVPVFKTDSRIWVFSEPANIKVKMPVANDLKSVVVYESTYKVIQDDLPVSYAIPTGIFDRCLVVQE